MKRLDLDGYAELCIRGRTQQSHGSNGRTAPDIEVRYYVTEFAD